MPRCRVAAGGAQPVDLVQFGDELVLDGGDGRVISAASSAGMAGGTGSIAAAPTPAPTVAVPLAAAATSLSASSSGPRPGNCRRRVARSRTGTRGCVSMSRSAAQPAGPGAARPAHAALSSRRQRDCRRLAERQAASRRSPAPAPQDEGRRAVARPRCERPHGLRSVVSRRSGASGQWPPVTADQAAQSRQIGWPFFSAASWLRWCTRKQLMQVNSSACRGSTRTDSSSLERSAPGSSRPSACSNSSTSTDGGRLVVPPGLQLLDAVLVDVVIGLAWGVVIRCHCRSPPLGVCGVSSARNAREAGLVPDLRRRFCLTSRSVTQSTPNRTPEGVIGVGWRWGPYTVRMSSAHGRHPVYFP